MEDPDRVVVEWGADIEVTATHGRYRDELIGIFTFRDGRVIELKEYFNPDNFKTAIARGAVRRKRTGKTGPRIATLQNPSTYSAVVERDGPFRQNEKC